MNYLLHSPSQIIARLLIDLGLGTLPLNPPLASAVWPVYASNEPSTPDNVLTIYDTVGLDHGRSMVTGEMFGPYGFQVRIRSVNHPTGYVKADGIHREMCEGVYQETVHVDAVTYLVHCISKVGDIMVLGKDPDSSRRLFTINAVAVINQVD